MLAGDTALPEDPEPHKAAPATVASEVTERRGLRQGGLGEGGIPALLCS
jgi:hypothetical protein